MAALPGQFIELQTFQRDTFGICSKIILLFVLPLRLQEHLHHADSQQKKKSGNHHLGNCIVFSGESSTSNPNQYACAFPQLIRLWRDIWHKNSGRGTSRSFPFGIVQVI